PSGLDALVLLSTCNNYESTLNACAFELHYWFSRERYSFGRVLSILESANWPDIFMRVETARSKYERDLFPDKDTERLKREARARVLDRYFRNVRLSHLLQQCRSYLVEYRNKHELFFDRFNTIVSSLNVHFASDIQAKIFFEKRLLREKYLDNQVGSW